MQPEFETVPCDLCGASKAETILSGHDRLTGLPGRFQFVRCLDCGLVRQNPRPIAILDTYYPDTYPVFTPVELKRSALGRFDRRFGQRKRVRLVLGQCRMGRLLDVGCGTGDFLTEMHDIPGWQVAGVEPVALACRKARSFGLSVVRGKLSEAAFPNETFDVVTMWHVLEHVCDPTVNLQEAHRILRPNGTLLLAVPVMDSLLRRWFGPDWVEWDLPRHTFLFSRQTMHALLQKTNFKALSIHAPFSEYRVLQMSLANWAETHVRQANLRRLLIDAVRFLPFRALLVAALGVVIPREAASVMVFVAQKQN
jgi:SAM-dependent methyltransferase